MTGEDKIGLPRPARRNIYVRITSFELEGSEPSLVVTTTSGAWASDEDRLTLHAEFGDRVRFRAASGSNNFDSALEIVDVVWLEGVEVLRDFETISQTRRTIAPSSGMSVLPGELVDRLFWAIQARVARPGSGLYSARLALFERDEHGNPQFVEVLEWPLAVTVKFPAANTPSSSNAS